MRKICVIEVVAGDPISVKTFPVSLEGEQAAKDYLEGCVRDNCQVDEKQVEMALEQGSYEEGDYSVTNLTSI